MQILQEKQTNKQTKHRNLIKGKNKPFVMLNKREKQKRIFVSFLSTEIGTYRKKI